jgi:glycosyltransferase involved in cell wall biosynthesis
MGIPCEVASLHRTDLRHPLAAARSVAAVLKTAFRERASLIHTNETPSFQPAGYAARLLRIPSVTHVRFPDNREGFRWFLRPGFSLALFVSHDLLQSAAAEAPEVFRGRSEVLHDGVELQDMWSADDTARCRQELGLPVDRPIVAMTGQVAEVKGIWDFVESARILASRGPEPLFAVVGDDLKSGGRTRKAMEERVEALGLASRFCFPDFGGTCRASCRRSTSSPCPRTSSRWATQPWRPWPPAGLSLAAASAAFPR